MAPSSAPVTAPTIDAPEVMDLGQVATYLGVTTRTVRRWRRGARPLPASPVSPFKILFVKAEVLDWIRSMREAPTLGTTRTTPRPIRRKEGPGALRQKAPRRRPAAGGK